MQLFIFQGTPGFRTHATRMMTVLQTAIDTFETEDVAGNLKKNFYPMAMSHAKRKTAKHTFFELREIVLEGLTEMYHLTEEQQEAWLVFYNCIINIIFGKFDDYNASLHHK